MKRKRLLAVALTLCMVLTFLPGAALAEEAPSYVAEIGEHKYATLQAAVDAVSESGATITLLRNTSGSGIFVGQGNKTFTIDFDGHTYTVSEGPVGSSTTKTQGLHLETGSITLKNGTITSAADSGVKMLVQNYCNLTLENMVLDGTNLDGANRYVLSNNSGTVNLTGTTSITAKSGDFAVDSCKFGNYEIPTVTFNTTGEITGTIELTGGKMNIQNGLFDGTLSLGAGSAPEDLTITGGAFTDLPNAVKYAKSGATIKLLRDASGSGIFVGQEDKDFTIDFGGHTYTVSEGPVGSSTTETQGLHLETGNITLRNGTITSDCNDVKMLVQNYYDLTLEDMVLDGTNLLGATSYVLSNNSGTVNITGATSITASPGDYAFDVCVTNNYPDGAQVTVDTSGTITGNIEYGVWGSIPAENKATLTIKSGNFNGGFEIAAGLEEAAKTKITITGGTFSTDPSTYVPNTHAVTKSGELWTVARIYTPPVSPPVVKPSVVTVPVSDGENQVDVAAQIEDGAAVLDVNLANLEQVVTGESPVGPLRIDLSGLTEPVSTVVLPAEALRAIADAANDGGRATSGLTIITAAAGIHLDARTLETLDDAGEGALSLTISPASTHELTSVQADLVGDGLIVRLEAYVGDTKVSDFGGGMVTVSIPVEGEPKAGVIIWRIGEKDDGSPLLTPIACTYNLETNCYEFQTPEFSYYALGQFPFTDVPGGAWFYENAVYAYQNGLMDGVGNDQFAPMLTATRGMLITVLWRLENEPEAPEADFADLTQDWYKAAAAWAADAEISVGYGDGRFGPEDVLTREQLVTILHRYAEHKGFDVMGDDDLAGFADGALVSDWARTPMGWAVAAGIVQGGDGSLMPQSGAARAQTAAILQRYLAG